METSLTSLSAPEAQQEHYLYLLRSIRATLKGQFIEVGDNIEVVLPDQKTCSPELAIWYSNVGLDIPPEGDYLYILETFGIGREVAKHFHNTFISSVFDPELRRKVLHLNSHDSS